MEKTAHSTKKKLWAVFFCLTIVLIGVVIGLYHFRGTHWLPLARLEKADRVVVDKTAKTLSLYKESNLLASYPVVFGRHPVGPKLQEGDSRTPEGSYLLDFKKPDSTFYKAIHISYPNAKDIASAKARGVQPGGAVMIHGQKNYTGWSWFVTKHFNWTDGCVALSNRDMDAVWESVDAGTPIDIKP